jgi:hypothetical protein
MNPTTYKAEDRAERIRKRAYEIFVQRGAATGKDLDDWLTAEREVDGGLKSPAQQAPPLKAEAAPATAAPKPAKQGFGSKVKASLGRG